MSGEKLPSESSPPKEESDFDAGIAAFKEENYERAAEIFEKVFKQSVNQYGELSEECAVPSYHYGFSLLHASQSSKEIFVENPEANPPEENEQETMSDLELAWEALEVARHAFEHAGSKCDHSRLADVHVALGDVACEDSNFESAIVEYDKAISHLDQIPSSREEGQPQAAKGGIQRRYCEVYYKACLANEFKQNLQEALKNCNKAIEAIRSEMKSADASMETELQEIERDLIERKEAIEISTREADQVKDMLRQMFQRQLTEPTEAEDSVNAVDLGIVGRGKNRIQLTKIDEEPQNEEECDNIDSSASKKRVSGLVSQEEEEAIRSSKKTKTDDEEKDK